MKVALTEPIEPVGLAILREAGHEVIEGPGGEQSAEALRALCAEASAVVVRQKLPDDLAQHCPKLLVAARHGVGVDLIPVEGCTEAGVLVTNVPGANADAVAEFVVAQMLAAARQLQAMHARHLAEGWKPARAMARRYHRTAAASSPRASARSKNRARTSRPRHALAWYLRSTP